MWPPATNVRPSASSVWPAQKMLSGGGTDEKALLVRFQTKAAPFWSAPSHTSTRPSGSSVALIATSGQLATALHCPIREGAVAVAFETVTVTGAEIVELLASLATAVMTCEPSPTPAVFQLT